MYAIIEVGANQYMVKKDDIIETQVQSQAEGTEVRLERVLLVSNGKDVKIGQPYVAGAGVIAVVLKHFRSSKVVSYKYRRRKSFDWSKGHRQQLTRLRVKDISLP